jgi:myxalamid-type polyketide synthase MxaE and MxaD
VTQLNLLDEAIAGAAVDAEGLAGILLQLPESTEAPSLPIRALQGVLKSNWRLTPRLWVVSQGARAVDPRDGEKLSIDHAAAWGGCRLIAEEHPDVWGGLVDLDPQESAADAAVNVAYHVLAADGEDQVAIRGNRRFVVRLLPKALDVSAGDFVARPDAAYLITGGLGYIGLELAKAMAARGARRLILMGHSALPPRDTWETMDPSSVVGRRVAAVRALEMEGVAIHLATVDVSDESALHAFLDRYNAEAWPPIRGVIHSAGAVDDCLVHSISQARFDALLGPKLRGAQHLDRLLPHLDLFALMSSMATFLPHSGQANYAAANAGLDALALNRRARGVPATSIGWGVWEDTGLIKDISGEQKTEILRRPGISVIPAARGADLFALLCQSGETVAAVLPIDWAEFRKARGARNYPIFSENMAAADAARTGARAANRLSLAGDDMDLTVRKAVGAVLKIPPSRLDARKPLGAMGLTSLMAIELRNMLEGALTRPLSATLAWNHPTIEALVNFLGTGASKPFLTPVAETGSTDAVRGIELASLSNLTDAEAFAALRSHRDEL